MNVAAHQEKENNEKTVKGKAGGDRLILKRLRATLLRSFMGLHGEKMVCVGSSRGNWDPREGQKPFRPNPNGSGTAPLR